MDNKWKQMLQKFIEEANNNLQDEKKILRDKNGNIDPFRMYPIDDMINTNVATADDKTLIQKKQINELSNDDTLPIAKKLKPSDVNTGERILKFLADENDNKHVMVDLTTTKDLKHTKEAKVLARTVFKTRPEEISLIYKLTNKHFLLLISEKKVIEFINENKIFPGLRAKPWTSCCLKERETILAETLTFALQGTNKSTFKYNMLNEYLLYNRNKEYNKLAHKIILNINSGAENNEVSASTI